tara:strand:- start:215808 stop:216080 length:273 start_codon:yes stop_codon:yes gene_type:complete
MRIDEIYDPARDRSVVRLSTDVRRPQLTLKHLQQMRKSRDFKRIEEIERMKLMQIMYGGDVGGGGPGGGLGGGGFGGEIDFDDGPALGEE